MQVSKLLLLFLLLLAGCAPAADGGELPVSTEPPSTPPTLEMDATAVALAAEFDALRTIPGQFSGGSFDPEVDQWQGRKHTLMLSLQEALAEQPLACTDLTDLLNSPDHVVKGGDPLHDLIRSLPSDYETAVSTPTEYLVYEWRGTHDFLFFVCQNGRVTAADWFYAGE